MQFGLQDETIVVAGGASGIGRATVELALANGCKVGILDADVAKLDAALRAVNRDDATVTGQVIDVRDEHAVTHAIAEIENTLGPIDGLVNSAGISRPAMADSLSLDGWKAVLDVNLQGSFLLAREVGKRMLRRGKGSIVMVSSVDGFGGHAARSHYTSSKFGVIGLVKSLAIEWGRFGVRVNAVCPGIVDTPLLRANIRADHIKDVMEDRVPMGRLSSGEDQAKAILFLLSDAAGYITGIGMPVDGGLTAGFFTAQHGADGGK